MRDNSVEVRLKVFELLSLVEVTGDRRKKRKNIREEHGAKEEVLGRYQGLQN